MRIRPLAKSARIATSSSPAIIAWSIARAETPVVVATSFIRRQNMMLSAYDPRPNNYYVNCSLGLYA